MKKSLGRLFHSLWIYDPCPSRLSLYSKEICVKTKEYCKCYSETTNCIGLNTVVTSVDRLQHPRNNGEGECRKQFTIKRRPNTGMHNKFGHSLCHPRTRNIYLLRRYLSNLYVSNSLSPPLLSIKIYMYVQYMYIFLAFNHREFIQYIPDLKLCNKA